MRTRLAATLVAGSLLTGAGAGALLFTPTGASAADPPPASASAPAPSDHDNWISSALTPLVGDGTITQAQADAVTSALEAARPEPGPGGRGPAGPADPQVVAEAIGISAAQLRSELDAGASLAGVAAAHGVGEQKVIDAIVEDAKEHLAGEVAAGRLTQAEADQRLADLQSRVKDMVERARPAGPPPAPQPR